MRGGKGDEVELCAQIHLGKSSSSLLPTRMHGRSRPEEEEEEADFVLHFHFPPLRVGPRK